MRIHSGFLFVVGAVVMSACAASSLSATGPLTDLFGSFNGARIEVVGEGGIAALSTTDRLTHDDRAFLHVNRHICAQSCTAPLDSAVGTLPASTTDSIFTLALIARNTTKDDYGTTPNAADMVTYTVRITSDGSTKTLRGDDGTMPQAVRDLMSALRGAIAAARR